MRTLQSLLLLTATTAVLTGSAFAQGPTKEDVKIYGFISGGSGCRGETSAKIITNSKPGSKGADYFQIVFDAFVVKFGPGIPRKEGRKNCNFTFNVDYPKGYAFKFQSLEFDGYVDLDQGTFVQFDSRIRAPFGERIPYLAYIEGPFEGDYGEETNRPLKKFETDCQGTAMLKIDTTIRTKGEKGKSAMATVDAASGLLTQAYQVEWRECEEWEM